MIEYNQTGVCPDNFTITCNLCGSTECDIEYHEGEGISIACYNCDNYFSED